MRPGSVGARTIALAVVVVVLIGAAALFLMPKAGGGGGGGRPKRKGIELKVVTRHDSAIFLLYKEEFLKSDLAREYNISDVRFLPTRPALWAKTIRDNKVDIGWGGGPTLFDDMLSQGLLAPITDPDTLAEIEAIPDEIAGGPMKRVVDGQVYWVAAAISSFGMTVNTHFLGEYNLPEPQMWEDLASEAYARVLPTPVVAFARATTSTSHTRIYEIILQKFGWDRGWSLIALLTANGRPYGGSVEAQTAVESGEVGVSISIDFYGYTSQIQNPACKYVLPQNESIVNGDPIALTSVSEHPEAAQAFIRFVLSIDGQKLWLNRRINRMPVRGEVFQTPEGQQRPDLYERYQATMNNIGIEFNDSEALSYEHAIREWLDAALVENHELLVQAWSSLVRARDQGLIDNATFEQLKWELTKPPTWQGTTWTKEYAQSVNDRIATDPEFLSQFRSMWRQAMEAQIRSVLDQIPPTG